ncbi:prenyltransferase [Ruminococcus sp.]|uniref:prenyltransferase n=1 Tax=Ruminococcus sp. TaxID=41978 RepID=UPI0025F87C66|nr:prenyltransferase [Ruminococcus sp.]MBQ8966887.1 prenyltransferase [Ruminococcus sp.]
MLKRLNIYFKEMYPLLPRLILGIIVFGEIYFIVLLNHGVTKFNIGIPEFVGAFTVFSFLCWLRIADDFKDYELDCRLFAHRPLPSGRVTKKDLAIFCGCLIALTAVLNLVFMNNFPFFLFLYIYGTLMSLWFFSKKKIQKSLPLALVTHNPVQMIMNIYIISFAIIKYDLKIVTLQNIMAVMTLYFPALIWEVTRKIRAPKDETEYVTYSKLFGYKKAATFALVVTILDIITNFILVWNLSKISVAALFINVCWMTWKFIEFMGDPNKFKIVDKVERYTYIQESIMLITVAAYILSIRFGFKLP